MIVEGATLRVISMTGQLLYNDVHEHRALSTLHSMTADMNSFQSRLKEPSFDHVEIAAQK